jgi:hypothetical protein
MDEIQKEVVFLMGCELFQIVDHVFSLYIPLSMDLHPSTLTSVAESNTPLLVNVVTLHISIDV